MAKKLKKINLNSVSGGRAMVYKVASAAQQHLSSAVKNVADLFNKQPEIKKTYKIR